MTVTDGRVHRVGDEGRGESHVGILARHGPEEINVGGPDPAKAVGTKGVAEVGLVGLVGLAAAVGNAVRHATGRRLRDLPFTLDRLMLREPSAPEVRPGASVRPAGRRVRGGGG